ncbi:GSCFA domain-containing protein [Azospirillum sp. TSO22-1]|uniref:GSCFA domain-containing protein n=1 Tax=Azospirillum sp. TSO22-1 TaxID=716789 RepID=UPI000D64271B|nr:GSCFA domain-containing protein [Azospirillum sp. TSO22-1]
MRDCPFVGFLPPGEDGADPVTALLNHGYFAEAALRLYGLKLDPETAEAADRLPQPPGPYMAAARNVLEVWASLPSPQARELSTVLANVEKLRAALAVDERFVAAAYMLGYLLFQLGPGYGRETARWMGVAVEHWHDNADAQLLLGRALYVQSRYEEALHHIEAAAAAPRLEAAANHHMATVLSTVGRFDDALRCSETAVRLAPDNGAFRSTRDELEKLGKIRRQPFSRFPERVDDIKADIAGSFRKHVLGKLVGMEPPLDRTAQVFTAGSCFAQNIALALTAQGVRTINAGFGELINSTFANRAYIERVCGFPLDHNGRALCEMIGRDPIADREAIARSSLFIFTFGVAPCFFDKATGAFTLAGGSHASVHALTGKCHSRMSTVQENVDNARQIFTLLRSLNPAMKIVVTLSPVPLHVAFGDMPAVQTDCLSKSTLRVAIAEALRDNPEDVWYWPAFEAVKWLGAYDGTAYGADDGASVHVSRWMIDIIIKEFVATFFKPAA